jgi:hypothetical protein
MHRVGADEELDAVTLEYSKILIKSVTSSLKLTDAVGMTRVPRSITVSAFYPLASILANNHLMKANMEDFRRSLVRLTDKCLLVLPSPFDTFENAQLVVKVLPEEIMLGFRIAPRLTAEFSFYYRV